MDRVEEHNKALLEKTFNMLATKVHEISIQEEQTTPRIVFPRVRCKLEEHSPGENGLQNL